MERSAIRGAFTRGTIPDFASLHPGYEVHIKKPRTKRAFHPFSGKRSYPTLALYSSSVTCSIQVE